MEARAGQGQLIDQFEGRDLLAGDNGVVKLISEQNRQIGTIYLRPGEWVKEIK